MKIASFHFFNTSANLAWQLFELSQNPPRCLGLHHLEVMSCMKLGAPVLSPTRIQWGRFSLFAIWDSEAALEKFMKLHALGEALQAGWHVRLEFLRQWGSYPNFDVFSPPAIASRPNEPVVSVTLAKLKLPELLRFIHWGKPVEIQVRDHPAVTLASAGFLPFRTFCTFSIWHSESALTAMVHGRESSKLASMRHAHAMSEQRRKPFHHHFVTLRFRPLSEHGSWNGKTQWLPATHLSSQAEAPPSINASIE